MASISDSYSPSPEKFVRRKGKGVAITSSDRAASSSDDSSSSSSSDEGGGSPEIEHKYTAPHARQSYGNGYNNTARHATDTRLAATDDEDDFFMAPSKALKERQSERSVTIANMQRLDAGMTNDDQPLRARTSNLSARHQINGVDAQNLYPPSACVFVANLPEPKDDVALEAGIYREFMKYGKCWVKIRRDGQHMPFAFVQFTSDEEAQEALEKGKGALIHGRPCRTEMVKANRTFIIQRKFGHAITMAEAEQVLLPYGSLSKCENLHPQLQGPLGFPPTVLVEFSMFDATRDLHTAFRSDPVYIVHAFDLKKNCAAVRSTGDEAFLANCERDRRSIFIGDLPNHVTREELEEIFAETGDIINCNLIQRTTNYGFRTMAFVEYTQPDEPEAAIAKFHGMTLHGATIRVERKSVKDRGPTPRASRNPMMLGHKTSGDDNIRVARSGSASTIMSTPSRHATQSRVGMQSPAAAQVPNMQGMYGSFYGNMGPPASPYASQNFSYAGHAGSQGMPPMTPSATPQIQMPSPWTYYNSFWPNMMSAYDPSAYYMGPYAFQSPTPMAGVGASAGRGNEGAHVQATPTRGYHNIEQEGDNTEA